MTTGDFGRVLPRAKLGSNDRRFTALLKLALSKFPRDVTAIRTVSELRMRRRGDMKGLVGLTTYCCVTAERAQEHPNLPATQTITFYSDLFDEISDESAVGVIAHELAHAWLNEHTFPEDSKKRELQADELARKWRYGGYLDALAAETDAP